MMKDPRVAERSHPAASESPSTARYTIELRQNADGSYFAQMPDLPGCMTEAETAPEVLERIEDAKSAWIATAIEDGAPVPRPRDDEDFSGRFVVRVPRSMHGDLVGAARREGVSLNTLVVAALARHLGKT